MILINWFKSSQPCLEVTLVLKETERVKHICSSLIVAWMKGTSWSVETTVFVITLTISTSSSSAREWHSLLNVCLYGVINSSVITQPPLRLHIAATLSLWNRTRCRNALILCFFLLAKYSELFVQFMFTVGTIRSRHCTFIYDVHVMTT